MSVNADVEHSTHPVGLLRLNRQGNAIWEAHHSNHDIVGNLVVRTTVLYYIIGLPTMHKHVFVARSIEDGSIVLQEDVPFFLPEDVPFVPTDYTACRLHLFGNGNWAAFVGAYVFRIWIINTNTGKVVSSFACSRSGRQSFSPTEARIWEIMDHQRKKFWLVSERIYDSNVETMIRKDLWLSFSLTERSVLWGFDGYRQLSFRAEYDRPLSMAKLAVGLLTAQTAQAYLLADRTRISTNAEISLATVTIPARSMRKGPTRQDLNICCRYRKLYRDEGFCGMAGDYLIIHARREKELILVDFWPTW